MPETKRNKFIKIIAGILGGILLLFIIAVLLIRSPWGQDIIVSKALGFVADKTGARVGIRRLFITFSGNAFLEGLYVEDQQGDTLVYSESLEISVALIPLIKGDGLNLKMLEWSGLTARVNRKVPSRAYNFDFLIAAFAAKPDTAKQVDAGKEQSSFAIDVGTIAFNGFDITYDDEVTGMLASLKIGGLQLEVDDFDLDQMRFHVESVALEHSEVTYKQVEPLTHSVDTTGSPSVLPFLIVDELTLDDVKGSYVSMPDSIAVEAQIGHFLVEAPEIDLANNIINIESIVFQQSDLSYVSTKRLQPIVQPADTVEGIRAPLAFEWPDWQVAVGSISLADNQLAYQADTVGSREGTFTANAMAFADLAFEASNVALHPGLAQAQVKGLSFSEASGLHLAHLAFDLKVGGEASSVAKLGVEVGKSILKGSAKLSYPSISEALNSPETSVFDLYIAEMGINVSDAFIFQPILAENKYLVALTEQKLSGHFQLIGSLADLKVNDALINWGDETTLSWNGALKNVLDVQHLQFTAAPFTFKTSRSDVLKFISEDELGVAVPETITLDLTANGELDESTLLANLTTPDGRINVNGKFSNKEQLSFAADIDVKELRLGKLLKSDQIGMLTFSAKASGSGTSLSSLNASLQSDFQTLEFNRYDFSGLTLAGGIKDGKGDIDLLFKDKNLDVSLKALMELDASSSAVNMVLDLKGADLLALGIAKEDIRARFRLEANFEGNADAFHLKADIEDGLVIYDSRSFPLGAFSAEGIVRHDSTSLRVASRSLQMNVASNTSPALLAAAIDRQLNAYFSDSVATDTVLRNTVMDMSLTVRQSPLLNEVLLPGLERLDSVTIIATFDEARHELAARVRAPLIAYGGSKVDSLRFDLSGGRDSVTFDFGWLGVEAGPLAVQRTNIAGALRNKLLTFDFDSYAEEEPIAHVQSEVRFDGDTITYHVVPSGFVLDKSPWSIEETNEIRYANRLLTFQDFTLSKNQQSLTVSSSLPNIEKAHIGIDFRNFSLATLLSSLNPDQPLVTGVLSGDFIVEDPFGNTGLLASLKINQLNVMEVDMGNMVVNAKSIGRGSYDFNLALKGGNADLDLTGDYLADEAGAKMNLDLKLNEVKASVIEGFAKETFSEASGSVAGVVKISGTTASPEYTGTIRFNAASLIVNSLDTRFTLPDETLKVDNTGLYMDNFTVVDNDENAFRLDGKVLTENISNPTFQLTINARNFQPVNASKQDNELFYGKVKMDADLTVGGDLKVPVIKGKLAIKEGTDFTFVVPESQVDVMEREGVVLFVNREDPDDILTRGDTRTASAQLVGYDVNTTLSVDKNATFKIIIDEKTGDNFQVSGTGDLIVGLEPNGRTTLSGTYSISSGHYEASLYNLVKKRFEISPQSTITWRGDPLDASLNVRAIYKVETSAAPLMAIRTSGESTGLASKYQQKLPFLVYLNVDGQLLQPELSFALDMPEDEQGAIGGDVYGRLQQLNSQEGELNKQVFSLLVLNRFFPGSGSDGSGGGAAAVARGNVNKVLSGQLNNFSDKLVGKTGLDLNFGLDSYTDYQGETPQDRTQLDINAQKKLFNDRLIVQVGSAVDIEGSSQTTEGTTPVIGNVSLEYLLSEDGRYRLKGFRKNEFESVIDGQLIVTGIAFMYNKEFNKFRELWQKIAKGEGVEGEIEGNKAEKK
ncbi:MAG: translocation/assembly module TamB domain-containing protein [Imperialibacter sp.]|uniref:translocation/assembly module TamB domain-containing protein n=1 Tax=Imperialibacter sp. TaxID=2038411 RepID=UPI0032EF091F